MLKIDNIEAETSCKICSKLTIKSKDQRLRSSCGDFVNSEQISFFFVFIVNFERVFTCWVTECTIIIKWNILGAHSFKTYSKMFEKLIFLTH